MSFLDIFLFNFKKNERIGSLEINIPSDYKTKLKGFKD